MEIAVFSDIHGNYAALGECAEYAFARGIRTYIFLGDYLGEFPYPQKTMEMVYAIREKYHCFFIRGNKEDYWINRRYHDCEWENGNLTVGAMKYCYANLTERDIGFFESLPVSKEIKFEGMPAILACHGSPARNNEKMLPDDGKTNRRMEECACNYILCGHTHLQCAIAHGGKVAWNPGSIGVSLHSGGKAQFMILRTNKPEWSMPEWSMLEWACEFVSLDYDKERIMEEMRESGLEEAAPYWTQVTKHLMLTGEVSQGSVLAKAMALCEQEEGKCNWYDTPDKYWERAIAELGI